MTGQIVVLTPERVDPGDRWPALLEEFQRTLAPHGVEIVGQAWTGADVGRLAASALVTPLLAWGYHKQWARWTASLDIWLAAGVPIQNPASVLRWNGDKSYLARLSALGAPVTPSMHVDRPDRAALEEAMNRFGTETLVLKPTVSASAHQTLKWQPGCSLDGGPTGAALIQPYLDSVEAEGEVSLIWFGGAFSHAVRKTVRAGDFRVQSEWGGSVERWAPDAEALATARAVLSLIEPLMYARVDLIRDARGAWVLMEAELIEPELFLGFDAAAGERLADAVLRCMAGSGRR